MAREGVGSALLAIDHADGRVHDETCATQRLERVEERSAGGHDVLDETDTLPRFVRPFETVAGPVLLRLLAHDHERQARLERGRSRERNRTELGGSKPRRVRCVLAHGRGYALPERPQDLRASLEAVLVEVVARALAGPE